MPCKNNAILIAAVLIVLAVMSPSTYAADPFRGSGFQLDESDLELVQAAAEKLYLSDGVAVGAVEQWSNPETGSRGTVELTRIFEYKSLPCRRLQHDIDLKRYKDPYRFTLDRCRVADGAWKILAR